MKFAPVIYTQVNRSVIGGVLTDVGEAVINYKGRRYAVRVEVRINDDGTPEGCDVQFAIEDSAPLTDDQIGMIKGSYAKWGGSPRFLQNELWPMSDAGIQYDYLCTIENEWGDAGNCNIFILTECNIPLNGLEQANTVPSYRIVDSFMEASCE